MRTILPGKPQAGLESVCTGYWDGRQLIVWANITALYAYITGNAFVIIKSPNIVLQTVYDEDKSALKAIAFDETSGKISTCAGYTVRIYKPILEEGEVLKWSLQNFIALDPSGGPVKTLSWGVCEELLVGGSFIRLYSTRESPKELWKVQVANTVKFAKISYDSGCIASTGSYDRLVKIWRRLSFGSDDVRFDFTYLQHPQTVTDLRWRRPFHFDQTIDNVLYTISADYVLRMWAVTDPHGLQILQLCAQLNLKESIQANSLSSKDNSELRYAFIIDGRDLTKATEHAIQEAHLTNHMQDQALDHLIEVANRSPEICVVLDERGHMSAWGLENIACKDHQTTEFFNISNVCGLKFNISLNPTEFEDFVQLYNYCCLLRGNLCVLIHHFDGWIELFESNIANLFDPSQRLSRVVSRAIWTGHSEPIKKVVRNISGRAVVTRTDNNESIVWEHMDGIEGAFLRRKSVITATEPIHKICILRQGDFVVFLHRSSISLWDCRRSPSSLVASCKYAIDGKPLCVLVLPEMARRSDMAHIATISSKMKGVVWQLHIPSTSALKAQSNGSGQGYIEEFCLFDLGEAGDLAYVLPVDPAGTPPVISGFLDTFARDVAISYTDTGILRSWTAKVDTAARKVDWLLTCWVETGIAKPSLASGSSIRKAALINSGRSTLTIWDIRGSQLEYTQDFQGQDSVQDLDWTSTPGDQSILAVGFQHSVLLLSQMRFDYLNKGPAWAPIQEISIRDLTPHPIGDSTWLGGGNLVIGSGNQLIVYDKTVSVSPSVVTNLRLPKHLGAEWNLFEIVTRINGPLPIFHPQFLGQCILAGKITLVERILLLLYKALKYDDCDQIDNLLGMDLEDFYTDSKPANTAAAKNLKLTFADFSDYEDSKTISETVALAIHEKLTKVPISQLSGQEQIHLADIVECISVIAKHRRSMDDNAARFMLFFRQYALRKGRANEVNLSWREINWAYHSGSQDILTDMVSHQFHNRMLWENARECGVFMWISDSTSLRGLFETIARNEYAKSELKNPADCSLFYLALRKKTVLQGLWRMAGWNREQDATLQLLSNNFQDPKWRTVALKNAYALLGKHRFEYAAAFFLLADCLKDAVNVCLNKIKDLQLAIAITRVYEGDKGPILRELLEEKVLPIAAQDGNRWLASWVFWMLHRRDMAVRALISPVYTLLETPQSPGMHAKLYLTDDPALIVLYSQLRQKTLQTLLGASKVTPKVEWAFVIHSARLYDRMGCDLLALNLVRNWEFIFPAPMLGTLKADPRRMFRRRSSLVVADLPVSERSINPHSASQKFEPLKTFEEPESSSLLDNFGF